MPSRSFQISARYLHLPVRNGAAKRTLSVLVGNQTVRQFEIELADALPPDWWAALDVSAWQGQTLVLKVDDLAANSTALQAIEPADTLKDAADLYREPLRPQLRFSSQRGWLNDPNGLVFYRGEYHLFYQHNPYGWSWGNMHWGHAVSRDLVHWQELGDALYPDHLGPMFSGSAVVDWKNTSGFGKDGQPPMVLIYTAAGNPAVQCLAWSLDGRTFTKNAANPVLPQITPGNRDPKVFWHEPTQRRIMALYVEQPSTAEGAAGQAGKAHTIHFLSSPNLKDWTAMSHIEGFFECPDLFELHLDGNPQTRKWILTAASSEYQVGTFDGRQFVPQTPKLPGHRGQGFYAAQTYSDIPAEDGRRIQIGWLQAPSPGMPFNQAMSLPLELGLISTPQGPRLTWTPAKEVESLRARSHRFGPLSLRPGDANPLAGVHGELLEVRTEFDPGDATEIRLGLRGASIVYDARAQELIVNGHRAPAPLRSGRQRLIIYIDRTALEVFASDGLTYLPMPFIPSPDSLSVELEAGGGAAQIHMVEVHELKPAWR